MLDITENTVLKRGLQLSDNTTLDLFTKGVVNTSTANLNLSNPQFLYEDDVFGENINPFIPQKWKIARNLQNLAQNVAETLITELGNNLMLHTAYVNPNLVQRRAYVPNNSRHFMGEALDFSSKEFESNMIFLIPELQKMFKGKIAELGLIYNQRSWVHIAIRGEHSVLGGNLDEPRIFTRDMTNNASWSGIYPARGFHAQRMAGYVAAGTDDINSREVDA